MSVCVYGGVRAYAHVYAKNQAIWRTILSLLLLWVVQMLVGLPLLLKASESTLKRQVGPGTNYSMEQGLQNKRRYSGAHRPVMSTCLGH